jgi:DNA-binding response OmpR family regulator
VSEKNLPTPAGNPEKISVLIATPDSRDTNELRHFLPHDDWNLTSCTSAGEAVELSSAVHPAVLICERDLPDGSWRDLLGRLQSMGSPPLLLVVSRHADESLWAEVLNLGGYDVLLKPFDRSEVMRVLGMAWRQWSAAHPMPVIAPPGPVFRPQFV